jgi:hypothetical protein
MQNISLTFEDYLSYISDESVIPQDARATEEKFLLINLHLQNAAYFINKLRRKQALTLVKREIERAIEERDKDCKAMKE